MEKIPTAKEFYLKRVFPKTHIESPDEVELWFETSRHSKEDVAIMIEFAKLHVEVALKAKVNAMVEKSYEDSSYSISELDAFTGDSYPLENIK